MSLQDLFLILKGGKGSGNWAHLGNPPNKGGSSRGGGFGRLGLKPGASSDEVKKASSVHQERKNKAKQAIIDIANELGYDPNKIKFAGEPYEFSVGTDKYKAGGDYNPRTGIIRLFSGAFSQDMGVVDKGLVSHEITHDKFQKFMDKAQSQREEINKRYNDEMDKLNNDWRKSEFMKASGEFKNPEDYKKYSARVLNETIIDNSDIYSKADGVSDYSRSYWNKFNSTRKTDDFYSAVNETLAEVARIKLTDKTRKIHPKWNKLYKDVMREVK